MCVYVQIGVFLQDFAAGLQCKQGKILSKCASKWMSNCFGARAPLWFSRCDETCSFCDGYVKMCQALESVINNYFKILHNVPTLKRPRPPRSAAPTVSTISCSSLTSRVEYKWCCEKKNVHAKEPAANALQPQKNSSVRWHCNPR